MRLFLRCLGAWWWESGGSATLEARRVSGLREEQGRVVEAKQSEIQKPMRVDLGGDQESIKQKARKYSSLCRWVRVRCCLSLLLALCIVVRRTIDAGASIQTDEGVRRR